MIGAKVINPPYILLWAGLEPTPTIPQIPQILGSDSHTGHSPFPILHNNELGCIEKIHPIKAFSTLEAPKCKNNILRLRDLAKKSIQSLQVYLETEERASDISLLTSCAQTQYICISFCAPCAHIVHIILCSVLTYICTGATYLHVRDESRRPQAD